MEIISVRIGVEADIARVRQVSDLIARSLGLESFARTRLVTAVLEIARNSLQYAGGGQARFSANSERSQSFLTVKVIDQGEGIQDPEALAKVRRPYLRTSGRSAEGLGLGLSGVKRLADRFDITSSDEGTRVDMSFLVPVAGAELKERVAAIATDLLAITTADPIAELSRQNRELAEAMAERELLIDEVHHRTGNNLALIVSLIQMSRRSATLAETKQVLAELETRVHSVARVHRELQRSRKADRIEFVPFLENVAKHAKEAFSSDARKINISVGGDEAELASNVAVDLGLVVGELITNAIKHAFPDRAEGRIEIRFSKSHPENGAHGWSITVSDNGIGFEEEVLPNRSQSLGWRMIRAMSARHGGTITLNGANGFTATLVFPPELLQDEKQFGRPS